MKAAVKPSDPSRRLFGAGLTMVEDLWTDEYSGTADALVTAGLARLDEFPGQAGRNKMMATFHANGGAVVKGSPMKRRPGDRCIKRTGKNRFCVAVTVDREIGERRYAAYVDGCEARQRRRRIEANAVVRFREGQLVRIVSDDRATRSNGGRVVRVVERIADLSKYCVPEEFEGMPLWRVRSERALLSDNGAPTWEALLFDAGLQPIDHLKVIPGGRSPVAEPSTSANCGRILRLVPRGAT